MFFKEKKLIINEFHRVYLDRKVSVIKQFIIGLVKKNTKSWIKLGYLFFLESSGNVVFILR